MDAKVEAHVLKCTQWTKLPPEIRSHFGNNEKEYYKGVLGISVQHQLRWENNLVKQFTKDKEGYYAKVIQYSREHLMLFPYHLSKYIIREMRVTPFQYYIQMVQHLFETEQSYDQLPNFTAADCLRVLGIGRNQYIEKMNQSRSKTKSLFRRRSALEVMPTTPVDDSTIEPWWIAQPGCILQDDIKTMPVEEKTMIDLLLQSGPQKAGNLNVDTLKKIYIKGLAYVDVPIDDNDYISVPPLEGFVMNRVLGDYLETLLYKVFISIDEYTPVVELANILDIELEDVKNAISIFCRLGFAKVKGSEMDLLEMHPSWNFFAPVTPGTPSSKSDDDALSLAETVNTTDMEASLRDSFEDFLDSPKSKLDDDAMLEVVTPGTGPANKRIGFLFDSTLTAFLMMGNLSPGLKTHAVTMFEVGKLTDESLVQFLSELDKVVPEEEIQGEARRYFDHAINLRKLIHFFRHNPALKLTANPLLPDNYGLGVDLLRCESLRGLDKATLNRVLLKNYALLVSMAPMSNESRPVCPLNPPHIGCPVPEAHSIWFKLYLYSLTESHPPSILYRRGDVVNTLTRVFMRYDYLLLTPWGHDSTVIPTGIALGLLHDALKHHPVLLQALGAAPEADLVHVPFPSSQPTENLPPSSFESHKIVKVLFEELQLNHTCGYITFLNTSSKLNLGRRNSTMDVDSISSEESSSSLHAYGQRKMDREEDWVLLDVTYGIPVFSEALGDEVSRRIVEREIFAPENLEKLENVNRKTGLSVLEFIKQHQDQPLQISTAAGAPFLEKNGKELVVLPTRTLKVESLGRVR